MYLYLNFLHLIRIFFVFVFFSGRRVLCFLLSLFWCTFFRVLKPLI